MRSTLQDGVIPIPWWVLQNDETSDGINRDASRLKINHCWPWHTWKARWAWWGGRWGRRSWWEWRRRVRAGPRLLHLKHPLFCHCLFVFCFFSGSVCLYVLKSVDISSDPIMCPIICRFIYLYIYKSIRLSIFLSVCIYMYMYILLCIYLTADLSMKSIMHLSNWDLSITHIMHLSICKSFY